MAQVKVRAAVIDVGPAPGRIDQYLDYLFREWNAISGLADVWSTWDQDARFDFEVDWPVREDRLLQLGQWASDGLLTPEQQARNVLLRQCIAEQRPVLVRVFAG